MFKNLFNAKKAEKDISFSENINFNECENDCEEGSYRHNNFDDTDNQKHFIKLEKSKQSYGGKPYYNQSGIQKKSLYKNNDYGCPINTDKENRFYGGNGSNGYNGYNQSQSGKTVKKEPYYLKMYINNINYSKEAKAIMNPVLVEVLYRVEPSSDDGRGQIIDLNDEVKSNIAQSLSISVRQVKEQISNLVESGILLYSQKQIYKLNYRYFAKGYFHRWTKYEE